LTAQAWIWLESRVCGSGPASSGTRAIFCTLAVELAAGLAISHMPSISRPEKPRCVYPRQLHAGRLYRERDRLARAVYRNARNPFGSQIPVIHPLRILRAHGVESNLPKESCFASAPFASVRQTFTLVPPPWPIQLNTTLRPSAQELIPKIATLLRRTVLLLPSRDTRTKSPCPAR